jgi:translation initiation factor 3 subunit I
MKPILLRGHEKPISVVKFNFDGDLLFTGAKEKRVNLWYSISGERIGSYDTKAAVMTLDVTNDSSILAVGTLLGTLEFFNVETGNRLGVISCDAKFLSIQFSYGDNKIIIVRYIKSL